MPRNGAGRRLCSCVRVIQIGRLPKHSDEGAGGCARQCRRCTRATRRGRGSSSARTTELSVFEAAAFGRVERLGQILDEDRTRAHAISDDGFTALHLAIFGGQVESVRLLLERGADPNSLSTPRSRRSHRSALLRSCARRSWRRCCSTAGPTRTAAARAASRPCTRGAERGRGAGAAAARPGRRPEPRCRGRPQGGRLRAARPPFLGRSQPRALSAEGRRRLRGQHHAWASPGRG